jgi:hypothetical protein
VEEEVFLPLKNSAYCGEDEDEGGSLLVKPVERKGYHACAG